MSGSMEVSSNQELTPVKEEVSMDEYKGLAQRVDLMESSVGLVLTKVKKDV